MSKEEKKAKTYYQSLGLELPDDVRARFDRKNEAERKIMEKNPDKFPLSWSSELGNVWDYIASELELTCFPPPLTVDWRRHPPRYSYDEKGPDGSIEKTTSFIVGVFNTACRVFVDQDNGNIQTVIPTDYELRIFQKNFELDLLALWGKKMRIPITMMQLHMRHTLIHECFHFINILDNYQKMITDKISADEMRAAVSTLGADDDERITETKATIALLHYCIQDLYGNNPGILEIPGEKVELGVIINGSFDLWMRQRNIYYESISLYLNWCCYNLVTSYGLNDDQIKQIKYIMPSEKRMKQMNARMIEIHEKIWKEQGRVKYIFLD